MRESTVQSQVCNYASTKRCLVYPFKSPANNAVPDRLIVPPKGECFFIEFKQFGKKPTAAQVREHNRMRKNGVDVFVVDSIRHGVSVIDKMLLGVG